jgi:hypothetical protein
MPLGRRSRQFDRRVSEHTMIGRFAWRTIRWLEAHHSDRAAWLGCYVLIVVSKTKSAIEARHATAVLRRKMKHLML